ncbi:MAG TPA: mechanosensitive ion channel family protein [Tepidisphaeraceae bacterium]|nr:mechanosensitive ion channel family protein [Tepidisphaeraceae bacterium]
MAPTASLLAQSDDLRQLAGQFGLSRTFAETPWSAWGVLLLGIGGGVVGGKVVNTILRTMARRGTGRGWTVYATVAASAAGPAYLAAIAVGLAVGMTPLVLTDDVRAFANDALKLLFIIAIAWFLFELVALVELGLHRVARGHGGATFVNQFVPLIRKTLRIFLVVVFVLFAAENVFDANIGAWLAGLGIAGLAVSLAAQDSIKNVFGSLTIFLDRPFAVGDRIVFDGHDGPVEFIGFRSTKIRTLAGDLVTVPNAKIVDGSVRNVGVRPSIQRVLDVSVTYDTTPAKVREAVEILRNILAEPDVAGGFDPEKQPPRVYFENLTADTLNLRVWYWFRPSSDWWAYMEHTQRVNLLILERFNAAGIEFAFPTRTVHVVGTPPPPPPPVE